MQKALRNQPTFDPADFRGRTADWKRLIQNAAPGASRVVIEWNVARGPSCFVYPAGRRELGMELAASLENRQSDERWADFLEFEFVPLIEKTLGEDSMNPQIICTDQRPIRVQRERRRGIEAIARDKAGVTH